MNKKTLFKTLKVLSYLIGFPLFSFILFLMFKPMFNANYMGDCILNWVLVSLGIWAGFELIRYMIKLLTKNKGITARRIADVCIVAASMLVILLPVSIYGIVQQSSYERIQANAKAEGIELRNYNYLLGWYNEFTSNEKPSEVTKLNKKITDFMNTFNLDRYETIQLKSAKTKLDKQLKYGYYPGVKDKVAIEIENKEKLGKELEQLKLNYDIIIAKVDAQVILTTAKADYDKATGEVTNKEENYNNALASLEASKQALQTAEANLAGNTDETQTETLTEAVNTAKEDVTTKENSVNNYKNLLDKAKKVAEDANKVLEEKTELTVTADEKYQELAKQDNIKLDRSYYEGTKIPLTFNEILAYYDKFLNVEALRTGKSTDDAIRLIKTGVEKLLPEYSNFLKYISEENINKFTLYLLDVIKSPEFLGVFNDESIDSTIRLAGPMLIDGIIKNYDKVIKTAANPFGAFLVSTYDSANSLIQMAGFFGMTLPTVNLPAMGGALSEMQGQLAYGNSLQELKTFQYELNNYPSVLVYANFRHIGYIFTGIVGLSTLLTMYFKRKERELTKNIDKNVGGVL